MNIVIAFAKIIGAAFLALGIVGLLLGADAKIDHPAVTPGVLPPIHCAKCGKLIHAREGDDG